MPLSIIFVFLTIGGLILPMIKRNTKATLDMIIAMQVLVWLLLILIGVRAFDFLRLPIYENTAALGSGISISLMLDTPEYYALLAIVSIILLIIFTAYRLLRTVSHISLVLLHFNLVGILGIVLTRDIFNLYIFIEIFTLTLIGMIKAEDSHHSTFQTLIFLFVNGVASAFFLLGTVLIYRNFGVLSLDVILNDPTILRHQDTAFASVLIYTAVLVKMMQFPLNLWARPILRSSSFPAKAYVSVIVPLVFTFELLKLSALMRGTILSFLLLTAIINVIWSTFRYLRSKDQDEIQLWVCFCLSSLYLAGVALMTEYPIFGWVGGFVVLTSLLKLLMIGSSSAPNNAVDVSKANTLPFERTDLNTAISLMMAYITIFLGVAVVFS